MRMHLLVVIGVIAFARPAMSASLFPEDQLLALEAATKDTAVSAVAAHASGELAAYDTLLAHSWAHALGCTIDMIFELPTVPNTPDAVYVGMANRSHQVRESWIDLLKIERVTPLVVADSHLDTLLLLSEAQMRAAPNGDRKAALVRRLASLSSFTTTIRFARIIRWMREENKTHVVMVDDYLTQSTYDRLRREHGVPGKLLRSYE